MLKDTVTVTGALEIRHYGADGVLKDFREIKNLVLTVGKTWLAARVVGSPAVMSHMALGSGTVAAVVADTALGSELARVAFDSASSASNVVTYVATFDPGTGTGAVTEAGLFNAASAGTEFTRSVFPVVNKQAADTISISWQITFN